MFFLLVGLVTEYYTGQSMPDQVYTIASLLLSSPLLKLLSSSLLSPLSSPLSLTFTALSPPLSTMPDQVYTMLQTLSIVE